MFQFTFCWCIYFPVSLQQPGVKLPSTQAIHIYFPNQQEKMCSGSEISGMVSAGWHWMWGVSWCLFSCNATACLICTGMETVSSTNNVVMLLSRWAETAQRQNNNNCLPGAYKKSVAEKQDFARDHNGRNILFSICVDFQIASCSLSEFTLIITWEKLSCFSGLSPSTFLLFLQLPHCYFLLCRALNSLGDQLLLVEAGPVWKL